MIRGERPAEHSPADVRRMLFSRHRLLTCLRAFFNCRGYIEVDTPVRVRCPGMDTYVDALPAGEGFFLATSPELQMKRLLGLGFDRIYQITHAFRAEEEGRLHSCEFAMLEWYRAGTDYQGILHEAEELLECLCACGAANLQLDVPLPRMRVADLYRDCAGWDPCRAWNEDRYFIDWVEKIEPALAAFPAAIIMDFPAPLAALARLKSGCECECERFELFIGGVEIANAFTELTDYDEHLRRFHEAASRRAALRREVYPVDAAFLRTVTEGLPECAGIALGVDRLVMALLGLDDLQSAQTFPLSRL